MVVAGMSIVFSIIISDWLPKKTKTKASLLAFFLIISSLSFAFAYFMLPKYFIFFIAGFAMLIFFLFFKSYQLYMRPVSSENLKFLILGSVSLWTGSLCLFWIPDLLFCPVVRFASFHAFFHIGTAIGTYFIILATAFNTFTARNLKPKMILIEFLWIRIPFVTTNLNKGIYL